MSALALSTLKLGLRHVNEVFGLSRLRHPGPILGRFPPRFSQVVMRLVADNAIQNSISRSDIERFIVIWGARVFDSDDHLFCNHFSRKM